MTPLLCPTAHAGTYMWQTTDSNGTVTAQSPTYTVGQISFRGGPGPDQDRPYSWNYQGCGVSDGRGLATDITCAGANQATFTWQPDAGKTFATDPPPDQVIVKEATYARTIAVGTVASPPTGSCSDGFGVVQSLIYGGNGSSGGVTLSGTRYSTHAGRQTVTLDSCEPKAHSANNSEESEVQYSANIYPLTINLTGPILDSSGNQNILIGQGCTASVSGIPADLLNNTAHPPTYQWSVSGNTFQSWIVTGSGNTSSGKANYIGDTTSATTHWYWDDFAGPQTVTCTVSLTPPDGQGSSFSVTVTKTVSLFRPQTTESPTLGYVQINNHAPPPYPNSPALYLGSSSLPSYGIIYTTQVQTPSLFTSQGTGLWNMVQITAPNTWTTQYGQTEQPDPDNGKAGLDTRYPFYPSASSSFPQGVPANNTMAQPYDSPGIASLSNIYVRYRTADSYQTYVMYRPPGSDTQWVPLWLVNWNWNADASVNSAPGFMWSNWDNTNSPGTAAITYNNATLLFPEWTYMLGG